MEYSLSLKDPGEREVSEPDTGGLHREGGLMGAMTLHEKLDPTGSLEVREPPVAQGSQRPASWGWADRRSLDLKGQMENTQHRTPW